MFVYVDSTEEELAKPFFTLFGTEPDDTLVSFFFWIVFQCTDDYWFMLFIIYSYYFFYFWATEIKFPVRSQSKW